MKTFLRAVPLVGLLAVAGIWFFGTRLPDRITVQRSLVVDAPATEIFARMEEIRGWEGWFYDPEAEVRFEGPERGPGAALILPVEAVDMRLELTSTSSPTRVAYRSHPDGSDERATEGTITLSEQAGRTRVTLQETGIAGGMLMRWMLYLTGDRMIGSIQERTLHNLKSLVETGSAFHGEDA